MHYTLEGTLRFFLNSARPPCIFFFVWAFREMIWAREPKGGEGAVGVLEVEILECASEWEGKH